jgi:hypothetical protein
MSNVNLTKADIRTILTVAGIEFPAKANLAALTALLPVEAPAPHAPPLPVTAKPVQVAIGLKIEKSRPEQNGVKRPSEGGRCRAVWDALDDYVADTHSQPDAKVVRALAADEGWNPNNASIEYYQWRKFNGITGRTAKAEVAAVAEEGDTDA